MMFNCVITNDYYKFLNEIVEKITSPRLGFSGDISVDYPDIGDWAQKVYLELKAESKRAIVAIFNNCLAGVIIYQRHKKEKDWLELKHLSVRPEFSGRNIASFLLRQAEREGIKEFHSSAIVGDAKVTQKAINAFLLSKGYKILDTTDLYGLQTTLDVVYMKKVSRLLFHESGKIVTL